MKFEKFAQYVLIGLAALFVMAMLCCLLGISIGMAHNVLRAEGIL